MADWLGRLGASPPARRLVRALGLPLPQPLARADGPWESRPLEGRAVVVGAAPDGALGPVVARTLMGAGAARDPGGAAAALVFDGSGIGDPGDLRALYDFFHPLVGRLEASGRVVVLGRPPSLAASARAAAARAALEGFVRSLAKEIGRRGATAQLVWVHPGAEARVEAPLRFLLSARAAFVTGQAIAVDARVPAEGEPPWVRALEGKVALVTGAARGIGAATARCLAREGARVVCLDRPDDEVPAGEVAREIGGELLLVDLAAADAPTAIVRHLGARQGVDVVVHNAGITRDRTLGRLEPEMWSAVVDVNLAAVARVDEALGAAGVLRERGRVVALGSVSGIAGNFGQTNYAASKAGVAGYVRARAGQLAGRGITVNAVAPGFIETRLTEAIPFLLREAGRRLSALGQGGLPADVAEAITFLATPGAAGITGSVLRVCGGAFIGA